MFHVVAGFWQVSDPYKTDLYIKRTAKRCVYKNGSTDVHVKCYLSCVMYRKYVSLGDFII